MNRGEKNVRDIKKKKLKTSFVTESLFGLGIIRIAKRKPVSEGRSNVPGAVEPLPLAVLPMQLSPSHPHSMAVVGRRRRNGDSLDLYVWSVGITLLSH